MLANCRLLDSSFPGLVDVSWASGKILSVAPAGSAPAGSVPAAQAEPVDAPARIDAAGRWLIPGLWDRHVHMNQWALARRRFDLMGATSAAHAAQLARAALDDFDRSSGQPLTGFGFRSGLWDIQPHKGILDEAVGAVPAVLISWDLHSAWLNTAALAAYGFSAEGDGIVRENDCFDLLRRLADVPLATLDGWVAEAVAEASSRGIVGVVDMEMSWSIDGWIRRAETSPLTLRVNAGVYEQDLDRAIAEGLSSGDLLLPPETGDALPMSAARDFLRMGPLKVIADGSLNTRTAYCFEPYGGAGSEGRGVSNIEPRALVALMSRARDAGIHCAIHAIGDAANSAVIDAFASSGAAGSIEHVQLLRAADVPRLAALGIDASVQPQHAVDDRPVTEEYWPDRVNDAFRWRSLVDAGVRLRFGSDAPVAPLDPWIAISAAVNRAAPGDDPWHPDEALTVLEAIAASSDSRRVVPAVGDPADLVLMDVDPRVAAPAELRDLPVAATLVGGKWSFSTLD